MFVFSSKIQSHRCTLESSSTRKNKWEQHWLKNNEICLFIIFVRVRDVVEKIQKYLMIFGARRFEFRLKSDQWTSIFLQRFPRLLRQHRWPVKEKKINWHCNLQKARQIDLVLHYLAYECCNLTIFSSEIAIWKYLVKLTWFCSF